MKWKEIIRLTIEYAEYVHWGKLIGFTSMGLLLGLILGIALVYFSRKFILVKRNNKWWKLLAYFWIIGIPLWSAYSGMKYGVIHAAEKNIIAEFPEAISSASKQYSAKVESNWVSAMLINGGYQCIECEDQIFLTLTPDNAIDIGVVFFYDYYVGAINQLSKSENSVMAKSTLVLKNFVSINVISTYVKNTIKSQLESKIKLDKKITKELLETAFKEYVEEGFLVKLSTLVIEDFFSKMKQSIVLFYFAMLLFPIMEISFTHYKLKKELVKND